jgi:hypothetical protein
VVGLSFAWYADVIVILTADTREGIREGWWEEASSARFHGSSFRVDLEQSGGGSAFGEVEPNGAV